jgi:type II secretory pathway pseudopilin PulG
MSLPLTDIGSAIAIVGLAISVITLYFNQRKTKKELELAKEYVHALSRLFESYRESSRSHQQLEKEKLDWDKLKTIGKALGWMIEYSEGEIEDE